MSDLNDILFSAQDGQLVANLAQRFGLTEEQMDSAVKSLLPALAVGLRNAAQEPSSFAKLLGALSTPDYQAAYEQPRAAYSFESASLGRDILADLFGSPSAASQVAQVAARESGLRPDVLSQLLPVLASILLGGLFKSVNNQGLGGVLGQLANSGALGQILEQVLGGGRAPQQAPAPSPPPMPQQRGGGLGGLLGGILGSLLGGRRAPPGFDRGDGMGRGGPLDVDSGMGGNTGPTGLPPELDQAALQQAIEQIKKTLQPGSGANTGAGGGSELEDIVGQMFGKR